MKSLLLLSLVLCSHTMALQDYCKKGYRPIANLAFELDLSQLNHNVILYQNVSTPPSTKSTVTEINICNALQHTQHKDECKEGTYLCQKIVYSQKSVDFVAEVHARVGDFEKSKLKTRFEPMDLSKDSRENGYRYRLTLSTHDQQAQITLECDTHQARKAMASLPTLVSYHHHALIFEWKTPWACSIEKEDDQASKRPIEPEQEGLSAICLFFILLLGLLVLYFAVGAAYNIKIYNAKGLDLIIHRDFWLDLPWLLKDLVGHVLSRKDVC